ncbi:GNAT family N-acetyltransferase [Nocardia crassostreae]|uniref:GNAT family N-acetyltransferase n=1 Tax=Nocardia crassostreae TaxID=53428 RepID=UPI000833669D|nr:GNAT family N-acetyltransferase [Nocardia crassostreae]
MTENRLDDMVIRRAEAADAPAVLHLFDEVIAWFVAIGNREQWGTEPWSTQESRVKRVTEACSLPGAWIAEHPRLGVCGALVLGEAMPYVPVATEPELYVRLLISSRDPGARGIGRRLLAFADNESRAAGLDRLRVDCYGGGTGALVRFYESCGYERLQHIDVEGWPCQVLGRTLEASSTT